jgi:Uma2 family endonuclease
MTQSTTTVNETAPTLITLNIQSLGLSEEQFELLCRDNRDMQIELTAEGELLIMPSTGSMTGWRNCKLSARLFNWAEANGTGICFDSSTLFTLPNEAKRSPDASWIRLERWNVLTDDEKGGFAPICPDFVIELRSPTDSVSTLQDEMVEYIENGVQLGWLIDPKNKQVFVYRPNQTIEVLENPQSLSGEPVLKGFVLNLSEIW